MKRKWGGWIGKKNDSWWINEDRIRKKKAIHYFICLPRAVFTDGLFACKPSNFLQLSVFVLQWVRIMSGSSTFIQQYFTLNLFQQGITGVQTNARRCLSVFTAMCSQFLQHLFCGTNQNCTFKDADWKTFVYFFWIPDGVGNDSHSAAAYHTHTCKHFQGSAVHERTCFRTKTFQGLTNKHFNEYIFFFSIIGIGVGSTKYTMRKQKHKTTFFNPSSSSSTGSVSQSRYVTATTWRPEM